MNNARTAIKRGGRGLLDRIAAPYVGSVIAAVRSLREDQSSVVARDVGPDLANQTQGEPSGNGTSDFFHLANHELRTLELERVPKGARRVLSVGANGRWYFDWFEKSVGVVDEHLGVEAFEDMPPDLPDYVTWIPDTADHMKGVADSSVDLVFAGQTTEHLWSYELSGFLEEAHRVLATDGLLVLDSPNRLVTEHLHWSHGGHTVELSADEIAQLVTLAGFEVISTSGIWRCQLDGKTLQLEEAIDDPAVFTRRAASAREHPDESFVWWLNARRSESAPNVELLRERAKELFESHWNTRVNRGLFPTPGATELPVCSMSAGLIGSTLPFPLKQGAFRLTISLRDGSWDDLAGFRLDVVAPGGDIVHCLTVADALRDGQALTWKFDQPHLLFAVSVELHLECSSAHAVLALPFDLRCDV